MARASRMDFAPGAGDDTERDNSSRSADSSYATPDVTRWTPLIPPVAKTGIPVQHRHSAPATVAVSVATARHRPRNVARDFRNSRACQEAFQVGIVESHDGDAAGDRRDAAARRHAARIGAHAAVGVTIRWFGESLGQDRTFKRHHRAPVTQGGGDFGMELDLHQLSGVVELFCLLSSRVRAHERLGS